MHWLLVLSPLVVIYVSLSAVFYVFQHFFFFRPEILPTDFKYQYSFDFEEKTFDMEDGGRINAVYFRVPNSRGVIYYLKGNSRSIKGWAKFARDFMSNGYDFFMMDYRGFGKSRGKRSEQILYNDAQDLYNWLKRSYPENKIVVYGRSLGSGIAARIASWNMPRMLILDSPYFSFYHQIKRFGFFLPLRLVLRYQIRTDWFIKKIAVPVYIIHGNRDRLIPYKHSQMLEQVNPELVHLLTIEGGGHNNLPNFAEYHEYLYDILNGYYEQTKPTKAV